MEPGTPVFILSNACRHSFQAFVPTGDQKMRNLLVAVCCAALVGSVSVASAQTTAPVAQDSLKSDSPMNANAKTKKKSSKKTTKKSDDSMKSDTSKDDMKKDSK
jgi:hypothetical protein